MNSVTMNKNRRERNYGIDLFRFVSMLMIVALHVLGNGGLLNNAQALTVKGESIWLLEIACCCSVNCFALISGYVGIHSKHKWNNLVSLSFQSVFYCCLFTFIYVCINLIQHVPLETSFLAKSLVPALFGRYWYFSAYFCLFFFMPILDRVVDMPRPILKRAAVAVVVIFCGISLLKEKVASVSHGYSFLWLAILYVVGGYIAKYDPMKKLSVWKSFMGYIISVLLTLSGKILIYVLHIPVDGNTILTSYTFPTVVLSALFLLNAFVRIPVKTTFRPAVVFLSSCSFGVYLIHCQPVIYDTLLKDLFVQALEYNAFVVIAVIVVGVAVIYAVCSVVEFLRKEVFKWTRLNVLVDVISRVIAKMFAVIEGNESGYR